MAHERQEQAARRDSSRAGRPAAAGRLPESPHRAAVDWLNGLFESLHSLATHPRRFPIAPENDVFEDEVRQLLHGTKHDAYRVLFAVGGSTVYIVHVRHAARRYLQADSSE